MILGASILQLPAIRKAKEMGLEVIAVDMDPEAIGFKEDGVIKEVISTIDIHNVVEAAKKHQIDGVMTLASDIPMLTVAAVAKELGLVGIDDATALKATNKAEMRIALQAANVPIPMFFRVNSKEEYFAAVNRIKDAGYKCIVKPVDNSGSRGINLLSVYTDTIINQAYDYSQQSSRSGYLMVEEFMDGPEVSVETLTIDGVCNVIQITDKLTTGSPYFVEMQHVQPSHLSTAVKEKIAEVAKAANHAIGIKNGPSHIEIIVTKDGPKIVELGARLGGDNITTHLVPLSTGINMVEACIRIALNEDVDCSVKFEKASAILYIETKKGNIKAIHNIDKAENVNGVQQVSITQGVGYNAVQIKNSVDRVGFIIAQGNSAKEAIGACETAREIMKFIIE